MVKQILGVLLSASLSMLLAGCSDDTPTPTSFRADFVPLKIVMTDYIFDNDGGKLFKIHGSAQLVVPLSSYEPELQGKCFKYTNLPRPIVDELSVKFDKQVLIQNDRGLFTSRKADSKRINELRKTAAEEMVKIAGSEPHIQQAMKATVNAMREFYEKFDGYSCSIQWESPRISEKIGK